MQNCTLRTLDTLKGEAIRLRLDQESRFNELAKQLRDIPTTLPSILAKIIKEEEDRQAKKRAASSAEEAREAEDSFSSALGNHINAEKPINLTDDDIETIENGVSALSLAESSLCVIAKEQSFLRTLNFASRLFRHDDIPLAHKKTFQWALAEQLPQPEHETEQCSGLTNDQPFLLKWLRHGDGAFWVSGKAGSGKSTLMKVHRRSR